MGQFLPGDRDVYHLRVNKGERLVIEVEARRISSALDPALRVMDAAGNVIARNQDAPGIGIDSRVDVRFPDGGDYYVEVRDARFGALVENFYRLKIGDFSYAEGIFPLGARKGESAEFEAFGGNLGKPVKIRHDPSLEVRSPDVGLGTTDLGTICLARICRQMIIPPTAARTGSAYPSPVSPAPCRCACPSALIRKCGRRRTGRQANSQPVRSSTDRS